MRGVVSKMATTGITVRKFDDEFGIVWAKLDDLDAELRALAATKLNDAQRQNVETSMSDVATIRPAFKIIQDTYRVESAAA